uniref:Transmembrane protein 163 n=1 Tax=Ornithorhynchus anatinus TaxID=9258 RepID=A0A6I8NNG3_ORNAN
MPASAPVPSPPCQSPPPGPVPSPVPASLPVPRPPCQPRPPCPALPCQPRSFPPPVLRPLVAAPGTVPAVGRGRRGPAAMSAAPPGGETGKGSSREPDPAGPGGLVHSFIRSHFLSPFCMQSAALSAWALHRPEEWGPISELPRDPSRISWPDWASPGGQRCPGRQLLALSSSPSSVACGQGFNSLVGGVMGFSILLSAEVFKHNASIWYLDGSIGVLIGLTIFAYGVKLLVDTVPRVRQTRHYEMFE